MEVVPDPSSSEKEEEEEEEIPFLAGRWRNQVGGDNLTVGGMNPGSSFHDLHSCVGDKKNLEGQASDGTAGEKCQE